MNVLLNSGFACVLALTAATSHAQDYPNKPITFIVPFSAGGSSDLTARTVAKKLSDSLGQPVVVENRPGAGGEVATAAVVRSTPDGYTVLVTPNGPITTGGFFRKQPYKPTSDLLPLTVLSMIPMVLAVNAQVPAKNLAEFVAYARQYPDKVAYGHPGAGSINHLNMELLRHFSGTSMTPVAYKGSSAAAVAVASSEVAAAAGDISVFRSFGMPPAGNGQVRLLATFSPTRAQGAPDVPTIAEAGFPNLKPVVGWVGAFVPANTPTAIANRLHAELVKILQMPDVRQTFSSAGMEATPMTRQQFASFVKDEIEVVGNQVRSTGVKLEQ